MNFTQEEWTLLAQTQRDLYRDVMWENYQNLITIGEAGIISSLSSLGNECFSSTFAVKWEYRGKQDKPGPWPHEPYCLEDSTMKMIFISFRD